MTKLESLSKNHNYLNLSLIDILKLIDPSGKSKYVELLYKLGPKNSFSRDESELFEIKHLLTTNYGISQESLTKYNQEDYQMIYFLVERFFISSDLRVLRKLHDLVSSNMIENLDISKINSYEEISNLVTLAEIKKTGKELEKKVQILLKNDNWLVLRPLSVESSLKYGASTKWCTASEKEPQYFFKYIKKGMLIYIINMNTGNKTAFFHITKNDEEKETSFWNVTDQRVDSIETDLTIEILELLRSEMKTKKSNWDLISDEEKLKIELEYFSYGSKQLYSVPETLRVAVEEYNNILIENEIVPNMRG